MHCTQCNQTGASAQQAEASQPEPSQSDSQQRLSCNTTSRAASLAVLQAAGTSAGLNYGSCCMSEPRLLDCRFAQNALLTGLLSSMAGLPCPPATQHIQTKLLLPLTLCECGYNYAVCLTGLTNAACPMQLAAGGLLPQYVQLYGP